MSEGLSASEGISSSEEGSASEGTSASEQTGSAGALLDPADAKAQALLRERRNPFLTRLFFLAKLPLAFIAGLRIRELTADRCVTSVPYGWRTQNPFRSTYFAAQSMAAELSTGALADFAVSCAPDRVAMLIVDMEASFGKKATDTAFFTCEDGPRLRSAVEETVRTGEAATAAAETIGRMQDGTEVSRFTFTWSFKRRR